MHRARIASTLVAVALVTIPLGANAAWGAAWGGPLEPPKGPIAPTQKPLGELEPRTPINSSTTPGGVNSVFRITQAGSYYLTANITGDVHKSGIEIAASNVTIDLNGFSLIGGQGSLIGIVCEAGHRNLAIRNGIVTAWGFDGISITTGATMNARVENITVSLNGGAGMRVAAGSVVSSCIAEENAGFGIAIGSAASISNVVARANLNDGVFAGAGSTVSRCAFRDNAGRGLFALAGCSISACSAYSNDSDGFGVSDGCAVIGCTAANNSGDGVRLAALCTALDNTCSGNGFGSGEGAGIHALASANRIERNNCLANDRGVAIDSPGNFIVGNACSANAFVNWSVAPGNRCLVVRASDCPTISGDAGGASLGSTDPNANFTY